MREIIKKIEKLSKTDKAGAVEMLSSAFKAIYKATQKGVIKKNNAARSTPPEVSMIYGKNFFADSWSV